MSDTLQEMIIQPRVVVREVTVKTGLCWLDVCVAFALGLILGGALVWWFISTSPAQISSEASKMCDDDLSIVNAQITPSLNKKCATVDTL